MDYQSFPPSGSERTLLYTHRNQGHVTFGLDSERQEGLILHYRLQSALPRRPNARHEVHRTILIN